MEHVVRGYVFNENGEVLLVKHNENGRWVLPGGHIEERETIYEAFEREIKEEFNFNIEIFGEVVGAEEEGFQLMPIPVSVYQISYNSEKWGAVIKIEYVFFADIVGGDIKVLDKEIFAYKWFAIDEVLEMDVTKDTYPQIPAALEKNLDLIGEMEEHHHH